MIYAEIPAKKVVAACDRYLTRRQLRIDARREQMITDEMARASVYAGMFKRRKPSREEAIAILKSREHGLYSEWTLPEITGGLWADKVNQLRVLAQAAGDGAVNVSAEDAHTLQGCFVEL